MKILNVTRVLFAAAAIAGGGAHGSTFAYVSNAEDGTISGYRLDHESGALTPVGTFAAGKLVMPMAVSPDRRHLYAAIRSQPYSVASYAIDPGTGALRRISTQALPESMAYLSTDRSGRFLFGASFGGDVISVSPIGPQGVAQGQPVQVIPTGRHAHSILADPSNRFVYVGNLGVHRVLQFALDEKIGTLKPIGSGFAPAVDGSGPRHLALSPNGRFLFVVTELYGTITSYAIDPATGALTAGESVEGVPARFKLEKGLIRPPVGTGQGESVDNTPRIWAADIKTTPDGRFVFMSERTSSTITSFRADPMTGKLAYVDTIEVEKQPRGFNVDSSGKWLVVAGEKSPQVGVYAVDAETGRLKKVNAAPAGKGANWVELVEFD